MEIIGHKKILDFLDESIRNKKVSHSYLFIGPSGVGKFKVASKFAAMLTLGQAASFENHPDITLIDGEGAIKIEQIRDLIHTLSLSPYSLRYKIAILDTIERLTREAANALLKTLEEPSPRSILILIASDLEHVLPTIISRCQIARFYPVRNEELKAGLENFGFTAPDEVIRLASGRPGIALSMLEDKEFFEKKHSVLLELKTILSKNISKKFAYAKEIAEKENISHILDDWILCFREELLYKLRVSQHSFLESSFSIQKAREIIAQIIKTKNLIEKTNVNTLLAIENMMLVMSE